MAFARCVRFRAKKYKSFTLCLKASLFLFYSFVIIVLYIASFLLFLWHTCWIENIRLTWGLLSVLIFIYMADFSGKINNKRIIDVSDGVSTWQIRDLFVMCSRHHRNTENSTLALDQWEYENILQWIIIYNYWTRLSKISWFISGEQINYLPMPKAEANNWSARIFNVRMLNKVFAPVIWKYLKMLIIRSIFKVRMLNKEFAPVICSWSIFACSYLQVN